MLQKIISGGQTGVDRGALDACLDCDFPHGGWCPQGRMAEDGLIDAKYLLVETPAREYAQRTEWNVRDSDATLIIYPRDISGGTWLTCRLAVRYGRPCYLLRLAPLPSGELLNDNATSENAAPPSLVAWLARHRVGVLNVAGPRESGAPGMAQAARRLVRQLIDSQRTCNQNPAIQP